MNPSYLAHLNRLGSIDEHKYDRLFCGLMFSGSTSLTSSPCMIHASVQWKPRAISAFVPLTRLSSISRRGPSWSLRPTVSSACGNSSDGHEPMRLDPRPASTTPWTRPEAEGQLNDTDARLWHPWLRINRVAGVRCTSVEIP